LPTVDRGDPSALKPFSRTRAVVVVIVVGIDVFSAVGAGGVDSTAVNGSLSSGVLLLLDLLLLLKLKRLKVAFSLPPLPSAASSSPLSSLWKKSLTLPTKLRRCFSVFFFLWMLGERSRSSRGTSWSLTYWLLNSALYSSQSSSGVAKRSCGISTAATSAGISVGADPGRTSGGANPGWINPGRISVGADPGGILVGANPVAVNPGKR